MNTKILMVTSSLMLGLAGIAASFAPSELLQALGSPVAEPLPVLIQLLGAMYIAFAITNWTAKDNMIGGIYSRPLSLGNCVHFIVGALALAKQQFSHAVSWPLIATLIVYTSFAICFAWLVFRYGTACKVADPEQQSSRS
ncbi:MAG TPA: hypothetical protein VGX92_03555 [Pyrinomonadaceae bacterium]|nr:hypothetical protein [Pyrinomonadaceae bacterium]